MSQLDENDASYQPNYNNPSAMSYSRPSSRAAMSSRVSLLPGHTLSSQGSRGLSMDNETLRKAQSRELLQSLQQFISSDKSAEKDHRNLKDPAFQKSAKERIFNFKNELNLAPDVTLKKFNDKSTPAFNQLFKAFYSCYDPSHVYKPKLKDEFFELLKRMGYPYHSGLPKNIIDVVGSLGNWEKGLGLLDWMATLLQAAESLKKREDEEMPIRLTDDCVSFYQKRKLEEFANFSATSLEHLESDLSFVFDERTGAIKQEISDYKEKMSLIEEEMKELDTIKKQNDIIFETQARYKLTIKNTEERIRKEEAKLADRISRIEKTQAIRATTSEALEKANKELEQLQKRLEEQPFTLEEIEVMRVTEAQLRSELNNSNEKLTSIRESEKNFLDSLANTKREFSAARSAYENMLTELDIGQFREAFCRGLDFNIRTLQDDCPDVLPARWAGVKLAISQIAEHLSKEKHQLQKDEIMLISLVEKTKEEIASNERALAEARNELARLDANYNDIKQTQNNIVENLDGDISQLNAKLTDLKFGLVSEIQATKDQVKKLQLNLDKIKQLSDQRIGQATQELKRSIYFADLLKSQSVQSVNSLKTQSEELIAGLESRLASLDASADS